MPHALLILIAIALAATLVIPGAGATPPDSVTDSTPGTGIETGDSITFTWDVSATHPNYLACAAAGSYIGTDVFIVNFDYDADGINDATALGTYAGGNNVEATWVVPAEYDPDVSQIQINHRSNDAPATCGIWLGLLEIGDRQLASHLLAQSLTPITVSKSLTVASVDPGVPFTFSIVADPANPDCTVADATVQTSAGASVQTTAVGETTNGTLCSYRVTEIDIPASCLVSGNDLAANEANGFSVSFVNNCPALNGQIEIGKSLTPGSVDPGVEFEFTITSVSADPICRSSSDSVSVAAGDAVQVAVMGADSNAVTCMYSIEEVNIPDGCTVEGENPTVIGSRVGVVFVNDCPPVADSVTVSVRKVLGALSVDPGVDAFDIEVFATNPECDAVPVEQLAVAVDEVVEVKMPAEVGGVACEYDVREINIPAGCQAQVDILTDLVGNVDAVVTNSCRAAETTRYSVQKALTTGSSGPGVDFSFVLSQSPEQAGCSASQNFALADGGVEQLDLVTTSTGGEPCAYVVEEVNLPEGCAVVGENPRALTEDLIFTNTCGPTSIGLRKVLADGSADPEVAFDFTISSVSADPICVAATPNPSVAGGELVLISIHGDDTSGEECLYQIEEVDLPAGCSVVGENPKQFTWREDLVFTNNCVAPSERIVPMLVTKVIPDGSYDPGLAEYEIEIGTVTPECVAFDDQPTVFVTPNGPAVQVDVAAETPEGVECEYSATEETIPPGCVADIVVKTMRADLGGGLGGEITGYELIVTNTCVELFEDVTITKVLADGSDDPGVPFQFDIVPVPGFCEGDDFVDAVLGVEVEAGGEAVVVPMSGATPQCRFFVSEVDLPAGCSVVGENPVEVGPDVFDVTFTNNCPLPTVDLVVSKVLADGSLDPGVAAFDFEVVATNIECADIPVYNVSVAAGAEEAVEVVDAVGGVECFYDVREVNVPAGCNADIVPLVRADGDRPLVFEATNTCAAVFVDVSITKVLADGSDDPGLPFTFGVAPVPGTCDGVDAVGDVVVLAGEGPVAVAMIGATDACQFSVTELKQPVGCSAVTNNPSVIGPDVFAIEFVNDCEDPIGLITKELADGSADPGVPFEFVVTLGDGADPLECPVPDGSAFAAAGETAEVVAVSSAKCPYVVTEVNLPAGCEVVGANPVQLTRGVFDVTFINDCDASLDGGFQLEKRLADGSDDPEVEFTFTIAALTDHVECVADLEQAELLAAEKIDVPIKVTTSDGTTCQYTVTEIELPEGCSVVGENPKTVGGDALFLAIFENDCDLGPDEGPLEIKKVLANGSSAPSAEFEFTITPVTDDPACTVDAESVMIPGPGSTQVNVVRYTGDQVLCQYLVEEVNIPGDCQVESANPQTSDQTFGISFTNFCENPQPLITPITITKSLSDDSIDPGVAFDFQVVQLLSDGDCGILGDPNISLRPGEQAIIDVVELTAFDQGCVYEVREINLPDNCSVVGDNPVPVFGVVGFDPSTPIEFVNECNEDLISGLRIGKSLAPGSADPGVSYNFTISSTSGPGCVATPDQAQVAAGTFTDVAIVITTAAGIECSYQVTEVNLPVGCSVVGENPVTVGQGLEVEFVNRCEEDARPLPVVVTDKVVVLKGDACADAVDAPLQVEAGDTVTYCLSVTNQGPGTAIDVVVVDDAGSPGVPGDDVVFEVGTLLEDQVWSGSYDVVVEAGSEDLVNTAFASGENESGDPFDGPEDDAETEKEPDVPLPVVVTDKVVVLKGDACADAVDAPLQVEAGDTVTYCLSVTNQGPGSAVDVVLRDNLGTVASEDDLTIAVGVLAEGASWSTTYDVLVTDGLEDIVNRASASGQNEVGDPFTGPEDTAETEEKPDAPLPVVVTEKVAVINGTPCADAGDGPLPVEAGDTVVFCLTVTNQGPGAAFGVTLTDDMGTPDDASDDRTWDLGELGENDSATTNYEQLVVAGGEAITNTARAAGTDVDGDPFTGPPGQAETVVEGRPDVRVIKSVHDADATCPTTYATAASAPAVRSAAIGDQVLFCLNVANAGDAEAADVSFSDDMGTTSTTDDMVRSIGRLAPGEEWSLEYVVIAGPGGLTNVATVTANAVGGAELPPAEATAIVEEIVEVIDIVPTTPTTALQYPTITNAPNGPTVSLVDTTAPGPLAYTGAQTRLLVSISIVLAAVGSVLLVGARRRND